MRPLLAPFFLDSDLLLSTFFCLLTVLSDLMISSKNPYLAEPQDPLGIRPRNISSPLSDLFNLSPVSFYGSSASFFVSFSCRSHCCYSSSWFIGHSSSFKLWWTASILRDFPQGIAFGQQRKNPTAHRPNRRWRRKGSESAKSWEDSETCRSRHSHKVCLQYWNHPTFAQRVCSYLSGSLIVSIFGVAPLSAIVFYFTFRFPLFLFSWGKKKLLLIAFVDLFVIVGYDEVSELDFVRTLEGNDRDAIPFAGRLADNLDQAWVEILFPLWS